MNQINDFEVKRKAHKAVFDIHAETEILGYSTTIVTTATECFEYDEDDYDDREDSFDFDELNPIPSTLDRLFDERLERTRTISTSVIYPSLPIKDDGGKANWSLNWAAFQDQKEEVSNMKPLHSKIKVKSKVTTVVVKKKNRFCNSILAETECPHKVCKFAHKYSEIAVCKCDLVDLIDNVKNNGAIYFNNASSSCTKKHPDECIESYLLRLQIKSKCEKIVINLSKEAVDKYIRHLLQCAKACGFKDLVINRV